jgi:predicted transcriptional regulator
MADLRDTELEALRILWEKDRPLKPAEIQEDFSWKIDNGTLRSTLVGMVEKGHVSRTKQGKAFFYRAKVAPESMLKSFATRLARVFTGGSSADLILQLIQTEKLSAEEIAELRRIAESQADETSITPKRRTKS